MANFSGTHVEPFIFDWANTELCWIKDTKIPPWKKIEIRELRPQQKSDTRESFISKNHQNFSNRELGPATIYMYISHNSLVYPPAGIRIIYQ